MSRWRKKIERNISYDYEHMVCSCMWPLKLNQKQLEQLEKVRLDPEEVQALKSRDLDKMNMQEAADKMGISKTVFAGIYTSAREKQTDCLINGKVLMVKCKNEDQKDKED